MTVRTTELAACVDSVERHFHHILDELETMRTHLVRRFDRGPVDSGAARTVVEPFALAFLVSADIVGAGYVAARDALSDQPLYLAWWQGDDQHLLAESDAPATGDPLDYTRHPWFRTPERTGLPHVTGPYVDFVCTDEYVMTATTPVISQGRMVGVVGADTLVETLERLLMPALRAAGATVVNDLGRAVASADPHLATGSLIHLSDCREVIACERLPLSVVRT
jgi:hypothetical protein